MKKLYLLSTLTEILPDQKLIFLSGLRSKIAKENMITVAEILPQSDFHPNGLIKTASSVGTLPGYEGYDPKLFGAEWLSLSELAAKEMEAAERSKV